MSKVSLRVVETPRVMGRPLRMMGGCAVVLEGTVMFMHYTSERAVPFVLIPFVWETLRMMGRP